MGRPAKFDADFRLHAVERAQVSGRPRCQVAADLGVSDTTLAKWMNSERGKNGDESLMVSERQELERLGAEKRQWIMEREILKNPMAFWVKELNG